MNQDTTQRLLALNRHFYTTVADDFNVTRLNLPMGMLRVLNYIRPLLDKTEAEYETRYDSAFRIPHSALHILDAGCGNGRFCWALEMLGTPIHYIGLDADQRLLELAQQHSATLQHVHAEFIPIDLAQQSSESPPHSAFRIPYSVFDCLACFAVLHHIPSYALRLQIVRWLASLLRPNGLLLLSTWQFLNSPRLVAKQLDWATAAIDPNEIEASDALLPWNQGTYALRYAHQIDEDEVRQLAAAADLQLKELYYADGKEGNLNLYAILELGAERV